MLITSRQKFALPGLQPRDLDTLPPEDARALLLAICPRIGALADELARVCGCLPLALRAAGSALAERIDLSPAAYRRRLEQAQARLSLIDASLSLSYELLPPEQRARWVLLAVFPADFDAAAASAVWNMDADAAQDALSDLVKWSVVGFSISSSQEGKLDLSSAPDLGDGWGGGGRYRLHDLARLFAAARLIEYYRQRLVIAHEIGDRSGESNILSNLGSAYAIIGEPRRAIEYHEQALNIAREIGDRRGERYALNNLGSAYQDLGEPRRAIEYHEQALLIDREIGDRRGEGQTLGNLGNAYADLGEPRRAIEYHEQALLIAREIGNRHGEGSDLGNLGSAYYFLDEPRRAIAYYEQALSIRREIGDRQGEGNDLGNLGSAYSILGEPRRAIEYYEQRLVIAREIGDRRGEGNALFNMSLALNELGERARAIQLASAALAILAQIEDPHTDMVREQLAAWQAAQAETEK